jgi:hypothetical protein
MRSSVTINCDNICFDCEEIGCPNREEPNEN